MRPFGRLLPYEQARARLLAAARTVRGEETVPLAEALGRVPTHDVRATMDVPPFARATWDGYAIEARRSRGAAPAHPRTFRLVGEVFAEGGFARPLGRDETVAIATGGALPPGSDAVVRFEEFAARNGWLTVRRTVRPGERVAQRGEDFARGTTLARGGRPLSAATLGAIAASGGRSVRVRRRPRVALFANGDELALPGGRRRPHQIFESNNVMLAALVAAEGGSPRSFAPLPDREPALRRAVARALGEHDLVLVTGGSSVGEHDFLPAIFPQLGRMLFHGLAIRPGKPTLAAVARGRLLIGMPGHPTSCLANGLWLLRPLLRRLAGLPGDDAVTWPVRMVEAYPVDRSGGATFVPLRIDGHRACPTFRDSSAITSLTDANGYILLPPGAAPVRRGQRLEALRLLPPLGRWTDGPGERSGAAGGTAKAYPT